MVEVKLFATFQKIVDSSELEIEADNIMELLGELDNRYPMLGDRLFVDDELSDNELRDNVMVLKNGKNIEFLDKLDTELDEGDRVAIFPPIAGG
ncbi:Molybdopterin converting factor small subunit MoaD [Methanonatronarchaeum thermophilum]|uniref:Molybdopterin converting factor small subunit MoaD n=1 Tax=Methanonatronarchaeum thermophilum TaxID=1927129 RepID=A0A1Y3GHA0_9EURY|nr:ubiquitin-like small modifier protein 1 [Methanonatronarchaeum thermophilum]OUJ18815.1 Molybdopterin converting factor small subunit MoaD [Methanonatronarchaeum thermophilum]